MHSYALDELTKDIIGILDHFDIEQTYLVGHDWGAAVAWSTAIQYPDRVKKLGILNVPHPAVLMRTLRASPRQMLKSWYIGFFQIPGLADWLMSRNNFAGMIGMLKKSGKPGAFSVEDLDEYRKAYNNSGGLTVMINWYRALFKSRPSTRHKAKIELPVLILWSKRDLVLGAEMAEKSLAYCENGEQVFFENATHWVQHDEAEVVTKKLLGFLKQGQDSVGH